MAVRFFRGTFISRDGSAVNDFELLALGTVTNLNSGVAVSGGCRWLDTIILPPR